MLVPLMGLWTAPQIDFPGGEAAIFMVLRWIHLVAGIAWVGLLYFFTLVNMPFLQELDAKVRGIVVPKLMPRALWWFRWSAVVTVLVGIAYWMHLVATDARSASVAGEAASPGRMFGSFFVLWTLAFAIEMGVLMSPPGGAAQRPGAGRDCGRRGYRRVVFIPSPQPERLGEQSCAGHRHRWRPGLVHAAQRLGHRLAHAEENDSLDRGQCHSGHWPCRPKPRSLPD